MYNADVDMFYPLNFKLFYRALIRIGFASKALFGTYYDSAWDETSRKKVSLVG